jgi:hypothetical protein
MCGWGRVDICMTFYMHAFDFFYTIELDNFQNCPTLNCQRNVNSIVPTQLPHKFQYILIHNYFESPNIILHYSEKIAVGQKCFFLGGHGHVCIDTFFLICDEM